MDELIGIKVENEMLEELIVLLEKHIEVLDMEIGVKTDKEFVMIQKESIIAETLLTKLLVFYAGCEKEIIMIDLKIEELKVLKDALYCNSMVFKNTVTKELKGFEDYIDMIYRRTLEENMGLIAGI